MIGVGPPAVAALVTVVVVLAGVLGMADIPSKAYVGLLLLLVGLAALAWGREDSE